MSGTPRGTARRTRGRPPSPPRPAGSRAGRRRPRTRRCSRRGRARSPRDHLVEDVGRHGGEPMRRGRPAPAPRVYFPLLTGGSTREDVRVDLNDTPNRPRIGSRCARGLMSTRERRRSLRGRMPSRRTRSSRHAGCGSGSSPRAGSPARPGPRSTAAGPRPDRAGDHLAGDRPRRRPGMLDVMGVGMLGHDDHRPRHRGAGSWRYLGAMLHGDEVWCQLFSEPAAAPTWRGSQTPARSRAMSGWRLTGQKVWTTNTHFTAYGLIPRRTPTRTSPKHKGLTSHPGRDVTPEGR